MFNVSPCAIKSKINFKTDRTGEVIKLNSPYINRVILEIYNTYNPADEIELKDIKYVDSPKNLKTGYRLFIKGKPILYFDRHHHYPKRNEQLCGVFEYLLTIQTYFDSLRVKRNRKVA